MSAGYDLTRPLVALRTPSGDGLPWGLQEKANLRSYMRGLAR